MLFVFKHNIVSHVNTIGNMVGILEVQVYHDCHTPELKLNMAKIFIQ